MANRPKITEADIRRFSAAILKAGLQPLRCVQKVDEVHWEFAESDSEVPEEKPPGLKEWSGKVWS